MAEQNKIALAKAVYETLCQALDNRKWHYNKDEHDQKNLRVYFDVSGDDVPMKFLITADAERQLIHILSPLPFKMSEEHRVDGALAVCAASYGMVDGSFDYDVSDGSIIFRATSSFRESVIGEELLQYMISLTCAMVDEYNDKFLAIDKGFLSINDFVKQKTQE